MLEVRTSMNEYGLQSALPALVLDASSRCRCHTQHHLSVCMCVLVMTVKTEMQLGCVGQGNFRGTNQYI